MTAPRFEEHLRNLTTSFFDVGDSLVLIVNTGLWHNTPDAFVENMNALTTALLKLARTLDSYARSKSLVVIMAETTAQHFHTATGNYDKEIYNKTKDEPYCKPTVDAAEDWRNNMLWERYIGAQWGQALLQHPRVMLEVLPMFELTKSLSDIHMRQYRQDCTHYCYTPMLYQPVYTQLRSISGRFLHV
jgi:hypothetical protein